jgi:penicillin-binding protein 2B
MEKRIRIRSLVVGVLFTLLWFGVTLKLYFVQVVHGAELRAKAEDLWSREVVLEPQRGHIVDRNGHVLAQDGKAYTVAVNPRLIHEYGQEELVVHTLAPLLGMDTPEGLEKLRSRVTAKNREGKLLAQAEIRNEGWKIDRQTAERIKEAKEKLGLQGIYLIEGKKRYYPAGQLASSVIGYVDKDDTARSGLELFFDDLLRGREGRIVYEKDALGYELPEGRASVTLPEDGKHLVLTIDRNIQLFIEEALEAMYEEYRPAAATVIAADPNTLEILGMASLPTFDPNVYWQYADRPDFAMNRAVSSQFEPGSTFKIVTLAGAVEEGLFDPDATYMSGRINVAGTVMGDHNNRQGWGEITYLEGLKRSSNVAFIKLGYEMLGAEKLRSYIEKFGFGQPTGIELPGEIKGKIDFRYPAEVANATFGQGVTVTAIQQIAAISVVANGGNLMKPLLVKQVLDPATGEVLESYEPQVVRRVISEQTAREVRDYLEQVVSDQHIGTGRRVYLDGYRVAAKTGTAQKVVNGKYAQDRYVVSIIGFAPADDPKIALLVVIDDPDIGGDYRRGGDVSAPVFRDIMLKSLRYLGVEREGAAFKESGKVGIAQARSVSAVTMPDLVGKSVAEAIGALGRYGIAVETFGAGTRVTAQYPAPGEEAAIGQNAYVLAGDAKNADFPDVTGRAMRDVLGICSLFSADCSFAGEGYADGQIVTRTGDGLRVQVTFSPYRPAMEDGGGEAAGSADDGPAEPESGGEGRKPDATAAG